MKIKLSELKQIIREAYQEINEMPVSKSRGWGMDKYEKNNPHLVNLAHEIDSIFQEWDIEANVKMFDSGYVGISIEFTDKTGAPQKWTVIDQPGKVGLEDQSMGYIFFGPGGPVQESNAWVWEQAPYLDRKFGDAGIDDATRRQTYDAIIDTIDDMMRAPTGEAKDR